MSGPWPLAPLVDVVIVITLLEAAALVAWRRRSGGGVAARDVMLNLLSGFCLMLALRSVVRDASEIWTLCWLFAAGVAHVADLSRRWERGLPAGSQSVVSGEPL